MTQARKIRSHFVTDLSDRVVSCADMKNAFVHSPVDLINGRGEVIGKVRCAPADLPQVRAEYFDESKDFSIIQTRWKQKSEQILIQDLELIMTEVAQRKCDADQVLRRLCFSLRAYLLTEAISIFGLPDGNTLQGLAAVFPGGSKGRKDSWNLGTMNLASHVIQTKKPYVSANPATDPLYEKIQGKAPPPNLVCYPILHSGEVIGLINASTRAAGPFGPEELAALHRFATVLGHLLREDFESQASLMHERTSTNLGKYLSTNVVRRIEQTGTTGALGGVRKHVVVLFSDIRGFTTLSASLTPEKLVSLLNEYFEEMNTVIQKYNGTLDKIVGDLMMVVWNIPHDQPEPEVLAIRAAIEMQKVVKSKVASNWAKEGVDGFGVGIGIHAGDAVVGNLGSRQFMNYTVIGPNVNLANRIESKCKAGEIWVHESLLPMVKGKVPQPARKESNLVLKGIAEPVNVWVFLPNS